MSKSITHGRLFEYTGYVLLVSLFFSHFLLSLSLIFLGVLSIWRYDSSSSRLKLNRAFFKNLHQLWALPLVGFILIFFLNVASGWNTENMHLYVDNLRVKLPYLVLPIIFLNHHAISKEMYYRFYYFLFWVSCLFAMGVMAYYLYDFEVITESIRKGQSIPTPINHTKFSVLLAIALNANIILWFRHRNTWSQRFGWIQSILILFLFFCLHILAVRSGLVCFYVAFLITTFGYFVQQRKYGAIVGLVSLILLGPYLAYKFVPSFQNKVNYTRYDISMYQQGKGNFYSDSERIKSFVVGMDILKTNLWTGVGIGDVKDECITRYEKRYEKSKHLLPHNQFLYSATAFGAIGLILFLIGYLIPLFYDRGYSAPLLLSFFIILTLFCLIERPIERSNFIVLHCFLVLCALRVKN